MNKILLAGSTGLLLAFATAGAYAETVYEYPDGHVEYAPSGPAYAPADPAYVAPAPLIEGRAAYVDDTPVVVAHPRYYQYPRYYDRAPFPFSVLPWNW